VTALKKPRRTDDPWDLTERPHTKAKLRLLGDYFGRWLTIWNAPKQRGWASSDWYVIDLFAGQGVYADGDAKVSGSPLVYLEQIARVGSKLETNGIRVHLLLVELNPKNYEMLKNHVAEFMEAHSEVKEIVDIKLMKSNCNSPDVWSEISSLPLISNTPLFMLIDPYGFQIQRQTMDRLVAVDAATDILFNYMVSGVKRAQGIASKPEEQLTQRERTTLTTYAHFLGKDVTLDEDAESPQEYANAVFGSRGFYVVAYDMDYPDRVGTLYYLLFVTKNRKIADMARKMFGGAKKQNYAGQLRLGDTEQFTAEITFFAPDGAA